MWNTNQQDTRSAYLERLLGGQDLAEKLASTYAEGVSEDAHFLDILHVSQEPDVSLQIFSGVELEALPFEGKDLRIRGHFASSS